MSIFIDPQFRDIYAASPLVLVDIGASGGLPPNWKAASQFLNTIGFEPDEREYVRLAAKSQKGTRYLNTALFSESRQIDFFLTRKQQTSSIYRPNRSFLDQFPESSRFDLAKTVKLKADTLDRQFEANKIQDVDFLKIDTQGTELPIMRGATQTIQRYVLGLEVEVEYSPLYEGQPLFADVDKFLQSQGFYLFDLKNYYWKRSGGERLGKSRGQIVCGDALYLRAPDSGRDLLRALPGKAEQKAKLLKMLSICALYGYYDYAATFFRAQQDLFTDQERIAVEAWLSSSTGACYRLPNFPGRRKVAKLFHVLNEVFRQTYNDWASIERELGNR